MQHGWMLAAAILAALAVTPNAPAATRDVVVLGGGASFREAVSVALSAWDIHVVGSDAPVPSSDVPRAAREARAIADRTGAAGVVWIGDHDRALLVYDTSTDQLVSRVLAQGPPFDAPSAAAAALSVKTLMRASTVAPPEERIGAASPTSPPADEPPPPLPAPALPPAAETAPPFVAEIGAGVRAVARDADVRIGIGGAYWFGAGQRVGVGLVGHAGPGLDVVEARFRGRFDELAASPSVRARASLGALRLEPRAGFTVHATRIDGVAVATAEPAARSRLDASIDAGAVFEIALTRTTRIGVELEGAWVLRYQRYLVGPVPVLELAPLQAAAGLRLAVGIP